MGNIIIKRRKDQYHTAIPTYLLRDKDISTKAKGLYAIIMSLPDNWELSIDGLISIVKEGHDFVRGAINELINAGYCLWERERNENGQLASARYIFLEESEKNTPEQGEPTTENPMQENPMQENPMQENPMQEKPMQEKPNLYINRIKEHIDKKNKKNKDSVPAYLKLENGKIADLSAAGVLLDVFTEWLQYKHERRERYKSQRSIDIKLRELREWSGNDPEVARQIVERSIGNNYAGLFHPNESGRRPQAQGCDTARANEDADPDFDRHYEEMKAQVRQREYNQRFGR